MTRCGPIRAFALALALLMTLSITLPAFGQGDITHAGDLPTEADSTVTDYTDFEPVEDSGDFIGYDDLDEADGWEWWLDDDGLPDAIEDTDPTVPGTGEDTTASQGPQAAPAASSAVEFIETNDGTTHMRLRLGGGASVDGIQTFTSIFDNLDVIWYPAYAYNFDLAPGYPIYGDWAVYKLNGQVVYCIEAKNLVSSDGTVYESATTWGKLSADQQKLMSHVLIYGATDTSNIPKHIATQALIWEIELGYRDSNFNLVSNYVYNGIIKGKAAETYYNQLVQQVTTHGAISSFLSATKDTASTYKLEVSGSSYSLTLDDTKGVIGNMVFPTIAGVTFSTSGSKLTIASTREINPAELVECVKSGTEGGGGGSLVFWITGGPSPEQAKAHWQGAPDPVKGFFKVTTDEAETPTPPTGDEYKITIIKRSEGSSALLPDAHFEVRHSAHGIVGTFVTDSAGRAEIKVPWAGTYEIKEITPPPGHLLADEPWATVYVDIDHPTVERTFYNAPYTGIEVIKRDAHESTPLGGATIRLTRISTGAWTDKVTGPDGIARFTDLLPDDYTVQEIISPTGYRLNDTVYPIALESGKLATVTITNEKLGGLYLHKQDPDGNPKAGIVFELTMGSGEKLLTKATNESGYVFLDNLSGTIIVREVSVPDNMVLDPMPQTIHIDPSSPQKIYELTFVNQYKPSAVFKKVDEDDPSKLLFGCTIRLMEQGGSKYFDETTGIDGLARFDFLEPDKTYIWYETVAPDGYQLDPTQHAITLKAGEVHTIVVKNSSRPGLLIEKLDSATLHPLPDALYNVKRLDDGAMVDLGNHKTDHNGLIFIPEVIILPGMTRAQFIITEIAAPDGYILDPTPHYVTIERGKYDKRTFTNDPYATLRLVKKDGESLIPLPNGVFKLYNVERREVGTYQTDALGEFTVDVPEGAYYIQEIKAPDLYKLDPTVRRIELKKGKTTTIEVMNESLGGLRVIKTSSADDKVRLPDAKFALYYPNMKVHGHYTTDQHGQFTVSGLEGQTVMYLREIEAPPGYLLDTTLYTVNVHPGGITEVRLKNDPEMGEIQVVKVAGEDNGVTGHKRGTGLRDAEFQILDEKDKVVATLTTDDSGTARASLPLGKYTLKESKPPKYYLPLDKTIAFEIKVAGDYIRLKVENLPEDISVSVIKRGPTDAKTGDLITYRFTEIANTSNTTLEGFYWRDILPVDAVRLETINTGTWVHNRTYTVYFKTNLKGWQVLDTRLSPTVSHELDCRASALRLAKNEYITEFKFDFGRVADDFREKDAPTVDCRVLPQLSPGYQIINKTDVGGRVGSKWTYARDTWVTHIIGPKKPLPQTGC